MRNENNPTIGRMKRRRAPVFSRAGLGALVFILGVGVAGAATDDAKRAAADPESTKQQRIYGSQGPEIPKGYVFQRGLTHYIELLPAGFVGALRKLGPRHRWLDIGAGSGQAVLDYYAPQPDHPDIANEEDARNKARAVALSIEDRRSDAWYKRSSALGADQASYLFGKRLREYSNDELGKFQMITDVYGGLSYTDELSSFMEKVLGILEVGGSFYSLLQSVKLEDGKDDPQTYYLTELVDPAGRDVKVCAWFKSMTCVEASCESKSDWEAPTELIHVRKVCDGVSVPPLVRLKYDAGTPPGRRFQLRP
jgi:hypothetical protein